MAHLPQNLRSLSIPAYRPVSISSLWLQHLNFTIFLQTFRGSLSKYAIEDLEKHFRNLNSAVTDDDPIEENESGNSNDVFDDTILNVPITEEEILKASNKLKNNKSPGCDRVINEYIKASMPLMIKQYVGLFNKILDTGELPCNHQADSPLYVWPNIWSDI